MARKNMTDRLIHISEIEEEIKLINNSETDYVTPTGKIYKEYKKNFFICKKTYVNRHNGYVYCGITMKEGVNKSHRVHKLVAEAYIPKIEGKDIVGHIDNNKTNNVAENLYWTTTQENTQKAYDDGLVKNRKGFDDEQGKPVAVYDLDFNKIGEYGSIRDCARQTGAKVSTIFNQCSGNTKGKPRKGFYYRFI